MGIVVLHPQDGLLGAYPCKPQISPSPKHGSLLGAFPNKPQISPSLKHGRNSTVATQSKRQRKRSPPKTTPTVAVKPPRKDFVIGEVKILKRGETIDTKTEKLNEAAEDKRSDVHLKSECSKSPLISETKMIPKENRLNTEHLFAGCGFFASPSPASSLPVPDFLRAAAAKVCTSL